MRYLHKMPLAALIFNLTYYIWCYIALEIYSTMMCSINDEVIIRLNEISKIHIEKSFNQY